MDILSLIGIPTTTLGAIWMLVRIGIWYWYNHTVGGKEATARGVSRDFSFNGLMLAPAVVFITGIVLWILL